MDDVIKEVAEAVDADGSLRWPPLSRECPGYGANFGGRYCMFDFPDQEEGWECPCMGDSGHVPDVTLEKALKEISKLGSFQLHCIGGRHGFKDTWWIVLENKEYQDYTEPILAACAVLLGSIRLDKVDIDMVD